MKSNQKLIGIILMVIIGAVATALGYNSEEIKHGICGTPPAPAPSVGVQGVVAPSN